MVRAPVAPVHSTPVCPRKCTGRRGVICAAQRSREPQEPEIDWKTFFDSLDSGDLGMPAFRPEVQQEKRKKKELHVIGNCYGCGVALQVENPEFPGFVEKDTYALKRQHKQQNSLLCARCQALTHGRMIPAVVDFSHQQETLDKSQRSGGDSEASDSSSDEEGTTYSFKGQPTISPQQFREQLKVIKTSRAVVVMIIDILDLGSFLSNVRDLIGGKPVIVVATKVDLLPKKTDSRKVYNWLNEFVSFKRLNCLAVNLVSSKTGEGFDQACASILSQRQGRDVYIVGAANVGKSAFVRRMLKEMTDASSRHFDAKALNLRRLPVESAMPGTTLGFLKLGAFSSGGTLYDTPGLHLHHRLLHILSPEELKAIHPKRRLRPYVAATPLVVAERYSSPHPCATYFWGSILRVDVVQAPEDTALVFFGTGVMQVFACQLLHEDVRDLDADKEGSAQKEGAAFATKSVAARGGLRLAREAELKAPGFMTSLGDVSVSGMPGWFSVISGGQPGVVQLRIHAPRGVEVALRPPMPCPTPLSASSIHS